MKKWLTISSVGRVIDAGLLFWAVERHPYSYYTLLRWITCAVCSYSAYVAYEQKKRPWLILFIVIAVLFNPIIPVHLTKSIWTNIDIASGIILIVSIFFVREKQGV